MVVNNLKLQNTNSFKNGIFLGVLENAFNVSCSIPLIIHLELLTFDQVSNVGNETLSQIGKISMRETVGSGPHPVARILSLAANAGDDDGTLGLRRTSRSRAGAGQGRRDTGRECWD